MSYVIALIAVVLLAAAWVGVQLMWKRAFPEACGDPDVLAGRMGCHGCDRTESCSGKESQS